MKFTYGITIIVILTSCTTPSLPSSSRSSSESEASSLISSSLILDSSGSSSNDNLTSSSEVVTSLNEVHSESSDSENNLFNHTYEVREETNETFLYWRDTRTGKLRSREAVFTTEVTSIEDVEGVYTSQPDDFFSTQFEGTKSSYVKANVMLEDQKEWVFADAVFGSLSNDKVVSGKAARIHGGGYIATQFMIDQIANIAFQTAVYGSDTPGASLALQVSQDGLFWETLTTYTPTSSLTFFSYEFDLIALLQQDAFDMEKPFAIKILNQNNETPLDGVRINIDSLEINVYAEPILFPIDDETNPNVTFSYDAPIPTYHERGVSFQAPVCSTFDVEFNQIYPCEQVTSLDIQQRGPQTLTYRTVDAWGYTLTDHHIIYVLEDVSLLTEDYEGFYDGIEGLFGDALVTVLREKILQVMTPKPYSDGKTVLPLSDVNPNQQGEAIAIYTGNALPSLWDGGVTWQREHVWPNSRLGVRRVGENDVNVASDLHNLRFIESSINASRSNKFFDGVTTSTTYNPGDDAGDVARIMFYMDLVYDDLVLTDLFPVEQEYMTQGAYGGMYRYLRSSHESDTVSAFETYRNDILESIQGHPNPFIDYPELVSLIYF